MWTNLQETGNLPEFTETSLILWHQAGRQRQWTPGAKGLMKNVILCSVRSEHTLGKTLKILKQHVHTIYRVHLSVKLQIFGVRLHRGRTHSQVFQRYSNVIQVNSKPLDIQQVRCLGNNSTWKQISFINFI